jgi:hypothetical protein
LMRGSVVAVPHLKQINALAAISVPQFRQVIIGLQSPGFRLQLNKTLLSSML